MKHLLISTLLAAASVGALAQAAKPAAAAPAANTTTAAAATPAPGTQQNKMKTCNADAKSKALKGDERKAFMKTCLSAKRPAA